MLTIDIAFDDDEAPRTDLAVIGHERNAWLHHVLANPHGPDVEAYLADRFHGNV